ncbi:MAG: acyl-CoA/acyl-ACP dehydrogenase [Actinomycetota bacterium]|nr:acyl-CoA/acyl-ACP dehydrogenase [Actinomycetota bacterium]
MSSIEETLARVLDAAGRAAGDVDRKARFPDEALSELRGSGLLGLTLPEDVGGIGAGPVEFLDVIRRIATRCPSTAMVYLMHVCATQVVLAAPPSGLPEAAHKLATGMELSTLAFSERGSRSHFWAPVSRLASSNGDLRLVASKSFVTSAGHADSYVVSVGPEHPESPMDSTLYLVPSNADGIDIGDPWEGLGLRGNASAPIGLDLVVGDGIRLGEDGKGLDLMLGVVLPWFQLGSGAVSLGIAQGALEATVAHVTGARLEHLGQSLADLPTVRARLGRAQVEVDTVAGFLRDVARAMAAADPAAPILAAKAAANEMAIRVTSDSMQACGGAAMSSSLPIERFFRDARAGAVMAPTTDVLYELTGRALVGMSLF